LKGAKSQRDKGSKIYDTIIPQDNIDIIKVFINIQTFTVSPLSYESAVNKTAKGVEEAK
jgi:hypothetical protein